MAVVPKLVQGSWEPRKSLKGGEQRQPCSPQDHATTPAKGDFFRLGPCSTASGGMWNPEDCPPPVQGSPGLR